MTDCLSGNPSNDHEVAVVVLHQRSNLSETLWHRQNGIRGAGSGDGGISVCRLRVTTLLRLDAADPRVRNGWIVTVNADLDAREPSRALEPCKGRVGQSPVDVEVAHKVRRSNVSPCVQLHVSDDALTCAIGVCGCHYFCLSVSEHWNCMQSFASSQIAL